MDIALARTFLMIADTGSFIEAARRMNVTQSTVSARVKTLEELLGRTIFERSKSGATLTPAGEQFRRHALALVRVWQHAQLEVGLSDQHRDHLSVAAPPVLWDGLLLKWVSWLRRNIPDISISAVATAPALLTQRMAEGTLDMAVTYRPLQVPGLVAEHLFDETFVMVTSLPPRARGGDYIYIDWGPEFQLDHAAAYPDLLKPSLTLDLGSAALGYLINNAATAYLPLRMARAHLGRGRLRLARRARRFIYPVYMVYPESRDEEAYEPILIALRRTAQPLMAAALD